MTHVLVLGGGFAGMKAAAKLGRHFRGHDTVTVTLVSQENYFLFSPMLPEVLAGSLEVDHIMAPNRRLIKGVSFIQGTVSAIDNDKRIVIVDRRGHSRRLELAYDYLLVALGSVTDFSHLPGLSEHGWPFKSVADALLLRSHIIGVLEEADAETSPDLRGTLLTFVIAGGGFTGIEVAAELHDFLHAVMKEFPHIEPEEAHVTVLHSRDRILPEVAEDLARIAYNLLLKRGIEVRLSTRLAAATPESAILSSGESIPTRTLICTVGATPCPVLSVSYLPRDEHGRLPADKFLQVEGTERVWAAGDCAAVPHPETDGFCPPTAQFGEQQGALAAANIIAAIEGREQRAFSYSGRGQFASLGARSAIGQLGRFKVSGFAAWWLWRTMYLWKLPRLDRRLRIAIDWTLDLFLPKDIVQTGLTPSDAVDRAHHEAGQWIFRQGDRATNLYILLAGQIEIIDEASGERLGLHGPGESFGEIARVQGGVRGAGARCLTAVDTLVVRSDDFNALTGATLFLRQRLNEVLETPAAADGLSRGP